MEPQFHIDMEDDEPIYITREQLKPLRLNSLHQDHIYQIVHSKKGNEVCLDGPLSFSFIKTEKGIEAIYFIYEAWPKFEQGLFSAYAIIEAIEKSIPKHSQFELMYTEKEPPMLHLEVKITPTSTITSGEDLLGHIDSYKALILKKAEGHLLAQLDSWKGLDE